MGGNVFTSATLRPIATTFLARTINFIVQGVIRKQTFESGLTFQRLRRWFAQLNLLILEVTQVSIVYFGYTVDSQSCRHHETHLSDHSSYYTQVALPT